MVNAPLFTTLSQMPAVSGTPFRVMASETWYYLWIGVSAMRFKGANPDLRTALDQPR